MKKSEWNSDHPSSAPGHGVEVWIAYQETASGDGSCDVEIGFFDAAYRKWRFKDGNPVADEGCHVCGWLPLTPPTYEADDA